MSYCRFTEADVYVFAVDGGITCCSCSLAERPLSWFTVSTAAEMVSHLRDHIAADHDVPEQVINDILDDADFIEGREP